MAEEPATAIPAPVDDPYNRQFLSLRGRVCAALTKSVAWLLYNLYNRCSTTGAENVPKEGPVLLYANHLSLYDPPLVGTRIRRFIRYMAKRELFGKDDKDNLFGHFLGGIGAFPVKRGGADRAAMRRAMNYLDQGQGVLIFPEGTRGDGVTIREFTPGVAMLALSNPETTIVPVRIRGSEKALPKGAAVPRPAKISVTIGKPFRVNDLQGLPAEKKSLYRALADEMLSRLSAL
ncbi:MAG: lysophospholipid acyltransferase family protein [Sumerlaeia bacterium]